MIESFQNPKIKNLIRLTTDNRFRKKQKVFIIEGQQENERALKFNFKAIEFFICEEIFNSYLPNEKINLVSKEILKKFKIAIDLIYNPLETKFLKEAKENGLKTINGLDMLIEQALKTDEILYGILLSTQLRKKIRKKIEKKVEEYYENNGN